MPAWCCLPQRMLLPVYAVPPTCCKFTHLLLTYIHSCWHVLTRCAAFKLYSLAVPPATYNTYCVFSYYFWHVPAGRAASNVCLATCMLQISPEADMTHAADCPACASLPRQTGFEQFDAVHAVVVVSINRHSFLPNAMRLKWNPSTSKAQLTADLAKVPPMFCLVSHVCRTWCRELPSMSTCCCHCDRWKMLMHDSLRV